MAKKKRIAVSKLPALSFRFHQETIDRLKILAEHNNRSATNMVEELVRAAYKKLEASHPDDTKQPQSLLKRKK